MANWDHRLEKVLDRAAGGGDSLVAYPCAAIPGVPLVEVSERDGDEMEREGVGSVETLVVDGRATQRAAFRADGNLIEVVKL